MENLKDTLLTMLAPILWGSTYIITSMLIPINRPIFVALMRGLPIGLILLLYYRQFPKGIWLLKSIVLGTLNIGGFFLFLFIAAYRLPGGIASILGSVQPIFTIFFSWIFLKEKPSKNSFIAVLMTITGVSLLLLKQDATIDPIGVIAALTGSIVMALGVVLTKYWQKPREINNMTFTAWQLFFGSLILIPITFLVEGRIPQLNSTNVLGLIILGIFNTALGYYLWFRGISKLTPTKVSFLGPVNPLTAFLLGFIFLKQTINFSQLLGVIIIIFSVYFSQKKSFT
ncbi:DMT family transporter [Clostridium manihotivorum]|uniref:EamA family transporter n=1 Tax=Clostridium manihotivorum TaxID=2320868 RepID=A0A410DUJ2_9CLOT|nr:EamA family transporter [Clostridium manihotivorum]QAA32642.1 EamA family transporter [Clostridium manihotivorum]